MLAITMTSERIGHWIKMRRSLARFSGQESLVHMRSLADFITTTSGFRFSVYTGKDPAHSASQLGHVLRLPKPIVDAMRLKFLTDVKASLKCLR